MRRDQKCLPSVPKSRHYLLPILIPIENQFPSPTVQVGHHNAGNSRTTNAANFKQIAAVNTVSMTARGHKA
jgi:hypothetical protein